MDVADPTSVRAALPRLPPHRGRAYHECRRSISDDRQRGRCDMYDR